MYAISALLHHWDADFFKSGGNNGILFCIYVQSYGII